MLASIFPGPAIRVNTGLPALDAAVQATFSAGGD